MDRIDWLRWRKLGIGGSDAGIIMGVSKFMTPFQLWEQKTSEKLPEDKGNFVTDRGNRFEPKIRALFNLMSGMNFEPALIESANFQRVSLDGLDGEEIIEIKTAGKEDHEGVILGKVPEKYIYQCQHALMVSKAKVCHYVSYWDSEWKEDVSPGNLASIQVFPDAEIQERLLKAETEFWECVQNKTPPAISDSDYHTITGLTALVKRYVELKQRIKNDERQTDQMLEELIVEVERSGHPRCLVSGIKFVKVQKIGNVQYAKIPELKNVDLEQYRGKSSSYWKTTI